MLKREITIWGKKGGILKFCKALGNNGCKDNDHIVAWQYCPHFWQLNATWFRVFSHYTGWLPNVIWTAMAQNWNRSFTHIKPHAHAGAVGREGCGELNPSLHSIYFHLSGLKPSLILIHFRYCSDTCSHCTLVWHKTYMIWNVPFSRSARCNFSPLQKSRRQHCSMCEKKPYPVQALSCIVWTYSSKVTDSLSQPILAVIGYLIYDVKHCRIWRI